MLVTDSSLDMANVKKLKVPTVTVSNGRAFCKHKGKQIYLGAATQPKRVLRRYAGVLLRISEGVHVTVTTGGSRYLNIDAMVLDYLKWAKTYYVHPTTEPNEKPRNTSELTSVRSAVLVLSQLYGDLPPAAFGPVALEDYRNVLADRGYSRSTTTAMMSRVRRVWRWACRREYIPAESYHRLLCVQGLRKGERNVKESKPVKAATRDQIDGIRPFLSPTVDAMVQVQWLCGMRPSEVCIMRPCDIDRSQDIWLYRPRRHKNEWRDHSLLKAIPAAAQTILEQWEPEQPDGYYFRPADSLAWAAKKKADPNRQTKRYPSEVRRVEKAKAKTKRKPKRKVSAYYKTTAYCRSLRHAFEQAHKAGLDIPRFTPNQLRHSSISFVAEMLGDIAAQRYAGHENAKTTEIYTREQQQAKRLIKIAKRLDRRLTA